MASETTKRINAKSLEEAGRTDSPFYIKPVIVNPHDAPSYDPSIDPTSSAYVPSDTGMFIIKSKVIKFNGVHLITGKGTPLDVIKAPLGSLYLNQEAGANTTLYIKETETLTGDATGWAAI